MHLLASKVGSGLRVMRLLSPIRRAARITGPSTKSRRFHFCSLPWKATSPSSPCGDRNTACFSRCTTFWLRSTDSSESTTKPRRSQSIGGSIRTKLFLLKIAGTKCSIRPTRWIATDNGARNQFRVAITCLILNTVIELWRATSIC